MNKTNKVITCAVAAAILGLAVSVVNPVVASTQELTYSVDLQSSTTVALSSTSSTINIANPTSAGTFGATDDINVSVYTNDTNGYQLTMTTDSTSLLSTSAGDSSSIATLEYQAAGYTQATFTPNRWGMSIDGGNYNGVSTSQLLKSTEAASGQSGSVTTVKFGTKIDLTSGARGTYQTTLNFAVTANVAP